MNFANVKEWKIPVNGTMTEVFKVTSVIEGQNKIIWEKETGPDYAEPFYVENITNDNETLSIVKNNSSAPTLTIEYKTNNIGWTLLGTTSTTALTLPLAPGEKVYLRCNANKWSSGSYRNEITGVSKVGGNIMSLLYNNDFANKTSFPTGSTYNFFSLFYENTNLVDASELLLPVTILTIFCYAYMFKGCTSLTTAPALPATILGFNCYSYMFQGCTSLTTAPALPATTLKSDCYEYMFQGCTSLTQAPALPATTLVDYCYYNMFANCTSLTTAPALPATILANYCYTNMFYGCTSLTQAPELSATTLVDYCYNYMFASCTSLNKVICYAIDISATNCTSHWLNNVSSTGTFTKTAGVTWPSGDSGIPTRWTIVEV